MIIRDYRQGDFPKLENLWKETGIFRPERGDTPEIILRCNSQGGKFLILEDEINNRIVGSSWLTWDGRRVLMQYFALLPTMQGLGYGRKLAVESMSFARIKKAPLKLEVHRDNIPAIQLYKNLGFKVLEGYEVYMVHYDA
jgi:ribosomal protein S18 acetylase RimI-like enzyme